MKTPYFTDICFQEKYFIDEVNIFNEDNRTFLKKVDLYLPDQLMNKEIYGADLYKIKGTSIKFKVAIKELTEGTYLIAWLNSFSFVKLKLSMFQRESLIKNRNMLKEIAIESIKKNLGEYIYSDDYMKRALITANEAKIECLVLDDDFDLVLLESLRENFFHYEEDSIVGFTNINEVYELLGINKNE